MAVRVGNCSRLRRALPPPGKTGPRSDQHSHSHTQGHATAHRHGHRLTPLFSLLNFVKGRHKGRLYGGVEAVEQAGSSPRWTHKVSILRYAGSGTFSVYI